MSHWHRLSVVDNALSDFRLASEVAMAEAYTDDLTRRRDALRQEISTVREAIADIRAQQVQDTQMDKLQNLRTYLALRERELDDVEARLGQRA
jgi:hypothetical protein